MLPATIEALAGHRPEPCDSTWADPYGQQAHATDHLLPGAIALSSTALASGDGTRPAKVAVTLAANQPGLHAVRLVESAGVIVPVFEIDASSANNPEGITLIRGGNHTIARPAEGQPLELMRTVADNAGNVFVVYTSPTQQFGQRPITRRIKPDNTVGFEKLFIIERLAGVAPSGDGGCIWPRTCRTPCPATSSPR